MSRTRQNLRWKRKKPTLENPKTYVGNSRFLGRVWRRDRQRCRSTNAALSFVQWSHYHSPFPIPRSPCACQRAVRMRGNGLRFARLCRPSASIRVLPLQVGRFARPCARSTYTYTPSGRSPAQLASTCFGPLGAAPCGHFASLVRSPASRSARLPSERLRLSSAHLRPRF